MMTLVAFQAAAQDTLVSVAARDAYDVLQAVAAAALVGIFFLAASAFVQTRRTARSLERARRDLFSDPAVEAIRRTASNVESISQALQAEVERLSTSVSRLSDRLTQASDRMEERIEEFNALMEVVQSEAEGAFVDGAATARGVRAGLGNLGGRPRRSEESPGETAGAALPVDDPDELDTEELGPSSGTGSGR